ncbi:uncharacterized protein LOC103579783 [Microplitis demolitor]|uniref:uncharacterized protein LOC103579783 n=1 Tax=Microplitis demolitor TaxID=69319 RepID=UPI0004CD237A|nr:uncharacterized protein LOC103579783 [Microplitis demolitor]
MSKDLASFKNDVHKIFNNIFELNDMVTAKNLMVWVVLVLISTVVIIILRLSEILKPKKCFQVSNKLSREKINIIADGMAKGSVMLNHIKSLRALHIATERCYLRRNAKQCVEIVTYCPHLVNVKLGPGGLTPFHRICNHGHATLMSFMLSKGADPWLTTDSGENALCLAINWCIKHPTGSLDCLYMLQRHGCSLDNTNKWFRIYLRAAMLTDHKKLVNWLFDQAAPLASRSSSFPLY